MIDLAGIGALALVSAEWLGLGWLSGVCFPSPGRAANGVRTLASGFGTATMANWALRLLVGSGLLAGAQLALALAGVGFSSIPLVLLVGGGGAAGLRALSVDAGCAAKWEPTSRREGVGWLLLGAILLAAVVRSLLIPEAGWDAYSHWGLRAQAFTAATTIVDAHSEHEYYPPLVPLLETWLYLHRGVVSIDLGKTVWAVIGSAFALCLAWHLRLSLRSAWLAPYFAGGIILGTTALLESFWTGQADLALTAYLSLATLAVWQWSQAPSRVWLVQAGLFAAAAALCKFEGLARIAVVVLALALDSILTRRPERRPAWWRPAVLLGFSAGLSSLAWTAFEVTHAIAPNAEHIGAPQPLAMGSVLVALVAVFGGLRSGGGVLIAALAWALAGRKMIAWPLRPLSLIVAGQLVSTLVAFLLSSTSPDLEVRTSATRLFEQWLPLGLWVGAVGLSYKVHL